MFNMANGREFPHVVDIPMLSEIGTNWVKGPQDSRYNVNIINGISIWI